MVAKTLFGFEEILAEELRALGAEEIEIMTRAVKYKGDKALLYKSNLHLRTAIKILKPLLSFNVGNEDQLYRKVKSIKWDEYFSVAETFAIDGVTSGKVFTHSKYAALKSKDAIVDQFRDKYGERPSVDLDEPDLRINIHIAGIKCTVSLDSSGSSLGKRGYKLQQVYAPLSEVMAAGMILLSGWDKKSDFIDPMCGSGTILIEAALMAQNIPAGSFRHFTFETWKDFDEELWNKIQAAGKAQQIPFTGTLQGYDNNRKAVAIAQANIDRADVADFVAVEQQDFFKSEAPVAEGEEENKGGMIMMNPPYGERLDEDKDMIPFYKEIGTHLKHFYNGWDAWILSGNLQALKFVGLRPSRKIRLYNGPLECKMQKYELYRGSKKAAKQKLPR